MEIKGIRETQLYLVEEVQKVYRDQGVSIHDKHIELIVRQMTRRIGVQEPGDTGFLPGERADAKVFRDTNKRMVEEGQQARPRVVPRSWASPRRRSPPSRWLSAASFQETTRVLTEAAIDGRGDNLLGLKENIIIGKLIPAGSGMMRYREFDVVGAGLPADGVLLERLRRGSGRLAAQHPRHLLHRRRPRRRRGLTVDVTRTHALEVVSRADCRFADRVSSIARRRNLPTDELGPLQQPDHDHFESMGMSIGCPDQGHP